MSGDLTDHELTTLSDRWQHAWAEGSAPAFGACCTTAVQYEDPLTAEPLEGLDALARQAAMLRAGFPDLRIERTGQPLGGGGHACLPWRLLGHHRGELGSLPPSGRFVIVHGVHYVELGGGAIRRARGFFDLHGAAVQLGLLPARGSLGETALLLLRGFGLRTKGA